MSGRVRAILAVLILGVAAYAAKEPANWPPQVGQIYPDVEMIDQEGQPVKLSRFKGRIIVVEPISMDCTACQAWSGAHRVGPLGHVTPQKDLYDIQTMFRVYGDISFDDPRFVFVQLLYFDLSRHPTVPRHAREWARHFGFDRAKQRFVLAGSARYRTPEFNPGTTRQIPGLQLIDENFILRSDATGHPPRDDIYRTTLPMIGQYVKKYQEPKGDSHGH